MTTDARHSDADLRTLLDHTVSFVGMLRPDGTLTEANAPALKAGGLSRGDVIGRKFWDTPWWSHDPDEVARLKEAVTRAAAGEVVRYDAVVRMADDIRMDIAFMLAPLRNAAGEITALVPSGVDITERKAVETRLRAAHDALRHVVDRSPFGIYTVDADFRLAQVSDGAQKVFESIRPLHGRDFEEVLRIIWPEPFASEAIGHFRHTLETGEPYRAPSTVETRADIDEVEAYDWKIERLMLPDGRPGVVCHFYDLSERQRHEAQIETLLHEINHRAKNMLALVLSIARQTAATRPEEFLERFAQRVQGLSVSQDLLVDSSWQPVSLEALIRAQLGLLTDPVGARIHLDGPRVEVTVTAAQAIGLAVHELAANALRHGALSRDTGVVQISWQVSGGADAGEFRLDWVETDGPKVAPPCRTGFGASVTGELVRKSLDGEVETRFAPEGLTWHLSCPSANVAEAVGTAAVAAADRSGAVDAGADDRILVVDDEPLIALDISDTLQDAGFEVLGPARTVKQSLELLGTSGCRAAIIDVNLGRETSEPLVPELRRLGIPFIAVSGYSADQLPEDFRTAPLVGKPLNMSALVDRLHRLLDEV